MTATLRLPARLLAWAYILLCGAGLLVGGGLCATLLAEPGHRLELSLVLPVFGLFATLIGLPGLVGGIALLNGKPWARPLAIGVSAFWLLVFPLGTALGAYGLWALLRQPAFAKKVSTITPPSPVQSLLSGYGGLLVVMASVAAGFGIVLRLAFWLADMPAPVEVEAVFPVALAVAAVVLMLMLTGIGTRLMRTSRPAPWALRSHWFGPSRPDYAATQRQRLATMDADPALRKYAERIRKGEPWSDAQIAYSEDPRSTATCVHLQPIERAMRATHLVVRRTYNADVTAHCCIRQDAFAQRFGNAALALYGEHHDIDRSVYDPKSALFWCQPCSSQLWVVHPEEAAPQTPWFPAP
ncbi:MAG: hypothetical protein ABIP34_07470 [Rhodoferax sp.]|uniref:hypothetical protein n=1 Tax=Rhodoferax sp. TaxID=50421 RepID=UPI003263E435